MKLKGLAKKEAFSSFFLLNKRRLKMAEKKTERVNKSLKTQKHDSLFWLHERGLMGNQKCDLVKKETGASSFFFHKHYN